MRRNYSMSPATRRMRYTGRKGILAILLALVAGSLVTADRMGLFGRAAHSGRAATSIAADLDTFQGKTFRVAHVVDGDTFDIDVPGEHAYVQRIRLLGVDTPETVKPDTPVQHFGPEASAFAKKTLAGQSVRIELDAKRTRDKYNRLLAYARLPDGRDFSAVLIEQGYGYADPRFAHPRKKDYEKLQKAAKQGNVGLWKDLKPEDLPYYYQNR